MNTTIISILTTISISSFALNASGQTYPSKDLQLQMQKEETAFLANMKPGLQHTQMLAVRDAMKGDYSALDQIRQSRNQAPVLPETVETKYITPDICLFSPVNATECKRPLLLYLHGGGWCFGSINSCARFCAALAEAGDCCVAALNYRLAPKYPFPIPLDDCKQAFEYLKQHAEEWGCDSSRIFHRRRQRRRKLGSGCVNVIDRRSYGNPNLPGDKTFHRGHFILEKVCPGLW